MKDAGSLNVFKRNCRYAHFEFVSTAKDCHSPSNHCRKRNSNCRARSGLCRPCFGSIHPIEGCCDCCHDRSVAPPLLLLPRHRALGRRKASRHSLRFLHRRRDRQSQRLSRRAAVAVRASPILWSADRKGFDAESCSNGQSNHVVRWSYVIRGDSNIERVLRPQRASPRQQYVSNFCVLLGARNSGQQLAEQHGRLFQGAPCVQVFITVAKYKMRLAVRSKS
jgi:hypothetical protein